MEQPLYALLVAPDKEMRRKILAGEITVSIRAGRRDYRPGPAMLCCHKEPWAVAVDITEVRHCTLWGVAFEECRANGCESGGEMLDDLRRYYPKISLDSPVTVIRWQNARGALVDKERARKRRKTA
jgi:hypothetical protein